MVLLIRFCMFSQSDSDFSLLQEEVVEGLVIRSNTFHFQYFGKRVVKEFRGNDSTKAAIEASKKLKGTTRYLLLTERSIKILKSDGKVG